MDAARPGRRGPAAWAASPSAPHPRLTKGRILAATLLWLAAAGCGPGDPLAMRVDAGDFLALSMWKSDASRRLTVRQLADFDEAVQEIKYRVMADGTASGGTNVDAASLGMIDGKTLGEVLRMGLGWELERVGSERDQLALAMDRNARLRTRPDDLRSQAYLSDLHDRQLERLHAADAAVAHVRERLAEYGFKADAAPRPGAGGNGGAAEPASEDEAPVLLAPKRSDH